MYHSAIGEYDMFLYMSESNVFIPQDLVV